MNNLLSYCGLVDAKIRASDKDLPVQMAKHQPMDQNLKDAVKFLVNSAMWQKLKTVLVAVRT